MRKNFHLQKFKEYNRVIGGAYPEALYKILVVNTSWAVNLAANLAMKFVRPNTRKKVSRDAQVKFVRDAALVLQELLADFEIEQIPEEFGGKFVLQE